MIDPAPKRYVALDSLRGIAAVMVAMHHFAALGLSRNPLIVNSWLVVDFFFVLSGFIISANYRHKLAKGYPLGDFMRLRLARVYPLHFVMLSLWVATEVAIWLLASGAKTGGRAPFTGMTSIEAMLANLFLVQSLGLGLGETWNWVAWSISTEVWTYVVFALLAIYAARHLDRALATVMIVAAGLIWLSPPGADLTHRWLEMWRCLYGFALGAILHSAHTHLSARGGAVASRHSLCAGLLEASAVAVGIAFVLAAGHIPVHLMAPLAFGPMVLIFAEDAGALSRLLATPLPRLLGRVSYSIYMVHPFVQLRLLKPLGLAVAKVTGLTVFSTTTRIDGTEILVWGTSPFIGNLLTLAMLGIVVGVSVAAFHVIEEPARLAMKRKVATTPASVPMPARST